MLCKKLGSLYRKYIKLNLKARDFIDINIKELLTEKGVGEFISGGLILKKHLILILYISVHGIL